MEAVAQQVRKLVSAEAPGLRTEVRWGHPGYVGTDMVCLVGAFRRHIGAEFCRGTPILDPDHPLEGTGKNLRHVKVRTLEDAASPQLTRRVREALLLDRTQPRRAR